MINLGLGVSLPLSLFTATHVKWIRFITRVADSIRVLRFDPEFVSGARNQVVNRHLISEKGNIKTTNRHFK